MKVFWWQAGLHFEPESEEDSIALSVLAKSLHLTDVDKGLVGGPIGSANLSDDKSVVGVNELH